ncbi:MAG: Gfo/Idh/MocA family protein [Chloroflexota bacterium]
MLGVGIIGCGLVGRKRAAAMSGARLVACADADPARAAELAATSPGAGAHADWRDLLARPDVDAVVIATTHDALAGVALAAIEAAKHVLVEKPAARSAEELDPVIAAERSAGVVARVGFNHRMHPAFMRAREIVDSGELGPLLYVRGRYGHGGRPGYDREWRADPARSGGGELIDQGVHLIDLSRWFLGEFPHVAGTIHTYFWNMPVEDNGFLTLSTATGQTAFLHASCTEWKNLFSYEIYGRSGKLEITGLGGSYGVERLAWYRMLPEMGPPDTTIWEYPGADRSWHDEWAAFLADIRLGRRPEPGLRDARAALDIVGRIYRDHGVAARAPRPAGERTS